MLKRYAVAFNGQTGGFEIHAHGCRDLRQPAKLRDLSGAPWTRWAESPESALQIELSEDFSGGDDEHAEHPARDGYRTGSYGAAGFGVFSRIFPCAWR